MSASTEPVMVSVVRSHSQLPTRAMRWASARLRRLVRSASTISRREV